MERKALSSVQLLEEFEPQYQMFHLDLAYTKAFAKNVIQTLKKAIQTFNPHFLLQNL